jgi:hypothetical protein
MKHDQPLNDRQLEVLRWVGDGCPDSVMTGHAHKISASALHDRRLVTVTRKRGAWQATLTLAGAHYLEHGQHPPARTPMPAVPATSSAAPLTRPTTRSTERPRGTSSTPRNTARTTVSYRAKSDDLLDRINAAGGTLVIERDEQAAVTPLVGQAVRRGKVPTGMRLTTTYDQGRMLLRLEPLPDWISDGTAPIAVPDDLRGAHPAIRDLRSSGIGIDGQARHRALRLLQALAKAATQRGHTVASNVAVDRHGYRTQTSSRAGVLVVTVHEHSVGIALKQELERVSHVPTKTELRDAERHTWARIPEHDRVPTERLQLALDAPYRVGQGTWKDTKTQQLEQHLADILTEIELRAAAAEAAEQERARQAQVRRERWEAAMDQARIDYDLQQRLTLMHAQVQGWQESQRLAQYVAALTSHISTLATEEQRAAEPWLAFCAEQVAALNPLRMPIQEPVIPAPHASDLQPFLHGGWHPYGPG